MRRSCALQQDEGADVHAALADQAGAWTQATVTPRRWAAHRAARRRREVPAIATMSPSLNMGRHAGVMRQGET